MNNLNYDVQLKSRNRINNQILEHPFTDYWDIFVLKHQNPVNIGLHILGIFFFYGLLFYTWKLQNFWLLLGLPLTQLIGLTGHILFERSHIDLQDAIFSWRASSCLGRMLFRVIICKYQEDIRYRKDILSNYQINKNANI
ncbi:Mpo1-like protein [Nostoc sp. FACHB-110]|uniref:Mpo1-like protein n=1 Tax=Nostoc sp. FACHB-110 TaxID=2692834 RepID=UPI001689DC86|nr:Mpo1-like protein [Nostoc sp. FACHB-110]MBD2438128.1 DUF962 domain-containing protein [Nostoc sp. FACHB-110]